MNKYTLDEKINHWQYRIKINFYKQLKLITLLKYYGTKICDPNTDLVDFDEYMLSRELCGIKLSASRESEEYMVNILKKYILEKEKDPQYSSNKEDINVTNIDKVEVKMENESSIKS